MWVIIADNPICSSKNEQNVRAKELAVRFDFGKIGGGWKATDHASLAQR
jgi:hypothetical protein